MNIAEMLAAEFGLRQTQVDQTIALIDEGNTIPFIARYRKEATGGLSDVVLRDLDERLTYLRNLEERKEEVIRLIDEQGKLTEELESQIREAEVLQRVEDLYKPFKKKKATRASKAREKGLEPLALIFRAQEKESGSIEELAEPFISEEKGVASAEEAVQGACDIIAEMISDDPELTAAVRDRTAQTGMITTEAADPEEKSVYDMYYEYSEGISKIPNHRVLAVNRGEKEKKLKVKVVTDPERMEKLIADEIITNERSIFTDLLRETIADAYKRLMAPSAEREMRNMLTERAEAEAVKVFAKNTEKLLMVPPVKGARIISIDPGYRTGCKVAVLNETGKLLAYTTVYPTEPKKDIKGTEAVFKKLIDKFRINTFVIGNGTASRETEEVVADFIRKSGTDISYTIVNEAGASVYSASKLATEEYPDLDVTVRGAMSAGRAGQDTYEEHRRRSVSARYKPGTAGKRAGQRGGRLREQSRRGSEHSIAFAAGSCCRHQYGYCQEHSGIPRGERRFQRAEGTEESREARRKDIRTVRRLHAHQQWHQSAGRHVGTSGILQGCGSNAR